MNWELNHSSRPRYVKTPGAPQNGDCLDRSGGFRPEPLTAPLMAGTAPAVLTPLPVRERWDCPSTQKRKRPIENSKSQMRIGIYIDIPLRIKSSILSWSSILSSILFCGSSGDRYRSAERGRRLQLGISNGSRLSVKFASATQLGFGLRMDSGASLGMRLNNVGQEAQVFSWPCTVQQLLSLGGCRMGGVRREVGHAIFGGADETDKEGRNLPSHSHRSALPLSFLLSRRCSAPLFHNNQNALFEKFCSPALATPI